MMQLLARWRNYKDLLSSEVDGTDVGNQWSACTCTQRTTVASPALQVIDNTDQRAAKTSFCLRPQTVPCVTLVTTYQCCRHGQLRLVPTPWL